MQVTTLRKNGHSDCVTIPKTYLRQLRWMRGQHVALSIVEGHLVVTELGRIVVPALAKRRKPAGSAANEA